MKKVLFFFLTTFLVSSWGIAQNPENDKQVATRLVQQNAAAIGLKSDDLSNSVINETYLVPGSNIRMVYLQQTYQGIPVFNRLNVLAFKNEAVASVAGERLAAPDVLSRNAPATPAVSAAAGVQAAMSAIRVQPVADVRSAEEKGTDGKYRYGNLGFSLENISAELIWLPIEGSNELRLTWQVFLAPRAQDDYWLVRIDARNGSFINKQSLTIKCNWDDPNHSIQAHNANHKKIENKNAGIPLRIVNEQKQNNATPPLPFVVNTASYRVIQYPAESPIHPGGTHALVTDPWTMSPGNATSLGWHFDGTTTFPSTRGNNVHAYEDRNFDNLPGITEASLTPEPALSFDYAPDYTQEPTVRTPATNQQFNTVNLFYWNNLIHDLSYLYGFTESARNFQNDNQGRGGVGLDYVLAEAQDGAGTNNANFSTPADGGRGRMQMFLWTAPTPDRDGDVDNGIIAHEYTHGISNRLTGTGIGCLGNAEQMGEGWSDYFGLMITHDWAASLPGDGFSKPRGIGTYALNQPITGVGIRQYPYTSNMTINPLTYGNLPTVVAPHGVGTIWCTALWDMTWEIIQTAGINPNIFNFAGGGGNAIALKLVTEGMRLQPCSPGFIDGRNAILKADTLFFGAQYSCAIINAFAKRGMGIGASQGLSTSRTDQVLSFVGCTATGCTAPVGLVFAAVTTNSATISWSPVSGAVSYDVDYKLNSAATWTVAATATTATSVNLAGLAEGSLYDWRVRTNCATESSTYSQAQFTTTAVVCNTPAGLVSSAITANSATVSWGAVSGANNYDVDYKLNSSATWINAATATTATSVNLTGLSDGSIYNWRVRTNCTGLSSAYAQSQFTTPVACPGPYDVSTNGTTAGAAGIPLNTDIKGTVSVSGDNDYYLFQISTGGTITLTLTTLPADYNLSLVNNVGSVLQTSNRNGTNNETISRTVTAGIFYARVFPKNNNNFNATSCYTLKVATGTATFEDDNNLFVSSDKNGIHPNPAKDKITVQLAGLTGTAEISIMDVNGKVLMQQRTAQATTALNISKLPSGIYMIKSIENGKTNNWKFVKQ
jgi:hypothetical protein